MARGRKKIFSDEYAEYRRLYKTYEASFEKRKDFQGVYDELLSEDDFYRAKEQRPGLSTKELAHKNVYGFTIQEKKARIQWLYDLDENFNIREIEMMTSREFAAKYNDQLKKMYEDLRTWGGMSGKEASLYIAKEVYGGIY